MNTYKSVKIDKIKIETSEDMITTFDNPKIVMNPKLFSVFVRAVDIVLGDRRKQYEMHEDEKIFADVFLTQKLYVTVTKRDFIVVNEKGEDVQEYYLDQISESEEGAYIRHFKDYKKETYPHKLKSYRMFVDDELIEFSKKTDGIGVTRGFRSYMTNFIRNFKPELLVKGKPYVLILNKKGEFCVEHLHYPGERALLSENEENIYHYLCYLHLSRFWSDIEYLKNQNHVSLPLVVDDFLDYLDESMDQKEFINRALDLNREAFFSSSIA